MLGKKLRNYKAKEIFHVLLALTPKNKPQGVSVPWGCRTITAKI